VTFLFLAGISGYVFVLLRGLFAALKFFAVRCGLRLVARDQQKRRSQLRRNPLRTFAKKFLMRRSQATSAVSFHATLVPTINQNYPQP